SHSRVFVHQSVIGHQAGGEYPDRAQLRSAGGQSARSPNPGRSDLADRLAAKRLLAGLDPRLLLAPDPHQRRRHPSRPSASSSSGRITTSGNNSSPISTGFVSWESTGPSGSTSGTSTSMS